MNLVLRVSPVVVALCVGLVLGPAAQADIIGVPVPYPTIQGGINAAMPGDLVLVEPGTYSPTTNGESFPIFLADLVDLKGNGGSEVVIIDAQQTARVLHCEGVPIPSRVVVTVEGFTITNGRATGLAPDDEGAGMYIRYADVSLIDCKFVSNIADYEGGGILCSESSLSVEECDFILNDADKGGGIEVSNVGPFYVGNSNFYENHVADHGAGIASFGSPALVESCLFVGNRAEYDGGAIVSMGSPGMEVVNCTMVDNWSPWPGSAISNYSPGFDLYYTIIAFNTGAQAVAGTYTWIDCTDIFANTGGDWTPNVVAWVGMNNNFSLDPLFCGPEVPDDPYSLWDVSPCAPANSPCGQLVGARPVRCPFVPVEHTSWGTIKAMYLK